MSHEALAPLLAGIFLGGVLGALIATLVSRRLRVAAHAHAQAEARVEAASRAEAQLRDSFHALAGEALRGNAESFLRMANAEHARRTAAIDALLTPVRDGLTRYDAAVQAIESERLRSFAALRERIDQVALASDGLRRETASLARALRSANVRGSWGEVQLRRVCELAGMLEHCDFETQRTVGTADGALRPDLVVRLPAGRTIVVDAKVPLDAFLEASGCEDEPQRLALLERHAAQLRRHVEALAQWVIVATPTTLIALLKAVAFGWRQERVAEEASRVAALGRELYERLRVASAHLTDVGVHLGRAVGAYNRSVSSMERRVLVSARRFVELGAAGGDLLPELTPLDSLPHGAAAEELRA